jgi:hypothetical protein
MKDAFANKAFFESAFIYKETKVGGNYKCIKKSEY